jgi:hypothetical protein
VIDGGARGALTLRLRFRRMGDRGTTHAAAGANLAVLKVSSLRYRFATALAAADPTTATPASGYRQVAEFLAGKNGHESGSME